VMHSRRHPGDRRQPDRRASGLRQPDEARLRQGAKLIVIDPRRIDLVRSPHIEAAHHLPLQPGTNVAVLTAMAHVIVTEGLADEAFIRERCDWDEYQDWARFVSDERHSPEALEPVTRVPAATCAPPRGSMPPAATARSITALASPSIARARPPSWPSPTSPWRPATSAGAASA
jgi:anaerobic selenocysteine-containing dehydrogenase